MADALQAICKVMTELDATAAPADGPAAVPDQDGVVLETTIPVSATTGKLSKSARKRKNAKAK